MFDYKFAFKINYIFKILKILNFTIFCIVLEKEGCQQSDNPEFGNNPENFHT